MPVWVDFDPHSSKYVRCVHIMRVKEIKEVKKETNVRIFYAFQFLILEKMDMLD